MQTFLPYPDFKRSFEVLDRRRLGNQVWREGVTLLGGGWVNHPASKMWRNHTQALADYCLTGLDRCEVVYNKKYPELREKILRLAAGRPSATGMPPWFGDPAFHAAHRSNLLRKNPEWYSQFGWTEGIDLEYIWPV
jgi:hypothetical protein